jgi:hypothetical protein
MRDVGAGDQQHEPTATKSDTIAARVLDDVLLERDDAKRMSPSSRTRVLGAQLLRDRRHVFLRLREGDAGLSRRRR